jgi:hypothetical protein
MVWDRVFDPVGGRQAALAARRVEDPVHTRTVLLTHGKGSCMRRAGSR